MSEKSKPSFYNLLDEPNWSNRANITFLPRLYLTPWGVFARCRECGYNVCRVDLSEGWKLEEVVGREVVSNTPCGFCGSALPPVVWIGKMQSTILSVVTEWLPRNRLPDVLTKEMVARIDEVVEKKVEARLNDEFDRRVRVAVETELQNRLVH